MRTKHAKPERAPLDRLINVSFGTEQSVYGVILVAGMIVASGSHGESSWAVFVAVAVTVVVFWAAHVYAGAVARHALSDEHASLPDAVRGSVAHSWGLLGSAIVPTLILLLGATALVDDNTAIWIALWAGVGVLAVLGYRAYAQRGASWRARALGAIGTASFGIVLIVLKALIH